MVELTHDQIATLRHWFLPERPGPLIGPHVIHSGYGTCHADRWPQPRVLLLNAGGNLALHGDSAVLQPEMIRGHIKGYLAAAENFAPLLYETFDSVIAWPRLVYSMPQLVDVPPVEAELRRLTAQDSEALALLSEENRWIWVTWGDASRLAASGYAWGAFVDGRLVAVANSFFVGEQYEDIGVVTEPEYRRRGLSAACVNALCADIRTREHTPSWTTTPHNVGSQHVAEKCGFVWQRHDMLYGIDAPPLD